MKKITIIPVLVAITTILSITLLLGIIKNSLASEEIIENPLSQVPEQANVQSIKITTSTDSLNLINENSVWKLKAPNGRADIAKLERINDFFNSLKSLKVQSMVANNQESRVELGLNPSNTIQLSIVDKQNNNYEFEFSDTLNEENLQLLAKKADAQVLSVDSGLITYLKQTSQYWIDKRIWPDLQANTEVLSLKIEVYRLGTTITKTFTSSVINGNKQWKSENDSKKSSEEIAGYINDISRMEGDELINPLETDITKFQKDFRVIMNFADGRERNLIVYKNATNQEYIASSSDILSDPSSQALIVKVAAWKLKLGMLE